MPTSHQWYFWNVCGGEEWAGGWLGEWNGVLVGREVNRWISTVGEGHDVGGLATC